MPPTHPFHQLQMARSAPGVTENKERRGVGWQPGSGGMGTEMLLESLSESLG